MKLLLLAPLLIGAAVAAPPDTVPAGAEKSPLSTFFINPTRVVWQSAQGVTNADSLIKDQLGQAVLKNPAPPLVLKAPSIGQPASIILDFGREIAGFVEIITPISKDKTPPEIRIRFGESVAETMAEPGERGAQNDHALRDQTVKLPWLGKTTIGPSGFRFVRIDAVDPGKGVQISQVRAVLQIRDISYLGSFSSPDERLNRIWRTGAWTVHLNMQDYLWDGIKRDRLVWLGDMHPEVSVINAVFGANRVVPDSLDLTRNITPVAEWMNGISSYSMWWILIHEEWFMHQGDLEYLKEQQPYLTALLKRLASHVGDDGRETLDGMRFLDWPTFGNKTAVHEGLQAMMMLTMRSGQRLMTLLGDADTAALCSSTAERLSKHQPKVSGRKSPAALLALAGLRSPIDVSKALAKDGPSDLSTFYGFYVIKALGEAGETDVALDFISRYWGGMLDQGATSFWEDFDLAWTRDAGRIDELVPPGKKDLHGDFGAHCYVGFRHSLCHGWAGGPTAFLSTHVLGIEPAAPGFRQVRISPHLGHLAWVEGSYPTPHGVIRVRHAKQADGTVKTDLTLPEGVSRVP